MASREAAKVTATITAVEVARAAQCTFARETLLLCWASSLQMVATRRTSVAAVVQAAAGVSQCTLQLTPLAIGGASYARQAARLAAAAGTSPALQALCTWTRTHFTATWASAICKRTPWARHKPTSRIWQWILRLTLWTLRRWTPRRSRAGGRHLCRSRHARCPWVAFTARVERWWLLLWLLSVFFWATMAARLRRL